MACEDKRPEGVFPDLVKRLPPAKMEFEGLRGWTLKGQHGLVVFMEAEKEVRVPRHQHGEQWGIVLNGSMELVIGDDCSVYHPGDTHQIPTGVEHEAILHAGWKGMYIFGRE